MRVYIPNSTDKLLNGVLKDLELFKQSLMHGNKPYIKILERTIESLKVDKTLAKCVKMLQDVHHVVEVETTSSVLKRLKDAMRELNTFRCL